MRFAHVTLATIVASLLVLPGCGPRQKNISVKKPSTQKTIMFEETKDGITLSLKEVNAATLDSIAIDSKARLQKNGILPIELTVTNNTTSRITFSPLPKNIPFAAPHKIKSALHTRAYYLVPAVLATTLVLTAITGVCAVLYAGLSVYYASISTLAAYSIMIFPTGGVLLLGSGGSLLLHKKLDQDYKKINSALCNKKLITVAPNNQFKAILLLDEKKLPAQFDVNVHHFSENTSFSVPTIQNITA